MMFLGVKACVTLLWGTSVLFSAETTSASIPETRSSNSTAEPDKADRLLTTPPHDDAGTQTVMWDATHIAAEAADSSTAILVFMDTVSTSSVGGPQLDKTSTTADDAQLSNNTEMPETTTPSEDQSQQQSSIASTGMTSPPTASTATSPQPTSTTKPDVTSLLFSSTSSDDASEKASTAKLATVFHPTSLPVTKTETPTASTKLSFHTISQTETIISTSLFTGTMGLGSTTVSPTSTVSNDLSISTSASATGIFIPHIPKSLPTTSSTPATTAAPNKVMSNSEVKPCSTREVVKQSLITIAILAGLATIFMVSTIILCTKLSARKYKLKRPHQETEMMCISALLPERNYTYTRQRNPISNGVLVMHSGGDSDEDGGDNFTLSSFLPENDRFV